MWKRYVQFVIDFFNLLYPSLCYACGNHLYDGEEGICVSCRMSLPYTFDDQLKYNTTFKVFDGRVRIRAASSYLYFKKKNRVQNLLHHLKYKGSKKLGIMLGKMHGEQLSMSPLFNLIDIVLPVPLHPEKLKQRGYNQSSLLAEGYADAMKIKWDDAILIRKTATSTQTKKSRYQRYENMQDVFECIQANQITNKNILLVDDVITTGSTLEACVETLIKSGCSGVWIATIAVA